MPLFINLHFNILTQKCSTTSQQLRKTVSDDEVMLSPESSYSEVVDLVSNLNSAALRLSRSLLTTLGLSHMSTGSSSHGKSSNLCSSPLILYFTFNLQFHSSSAHEEQRDPAPAPAPQLRSYRTLGTWLHLAESPTCKVNQTLPPGAVDFSVSISRKNHSDYIVSEVLKFLPPRTVYY